MTIIRTLTVHTRKQHVCFGCGRQFPAGTDMRFDAIADCGTGWNSYLRSTCNRITHNMKWGDEFGFMDLREEALEIERANNLNHENF